MGRKPIINRHQLLDHAEDIVRQRGPTALTLSGLAEAAGISKGGVQYSFTSKEEIVRALIDRWMSRFKSLIEDLDPQDPLMFMRSYLAAVCASETASNARLSGLVLSYMQDPANKSDIRQWYEDIFARLAGSSRACKRARVAFLAIEGHLAIRLNCVNEGFCWDELLEDIEDILTIDAPPS